MPEAKKTENPTDRPAGFSALARDTCPAKKSHQREMKTCLVVASVIACLLAAGFVGVRKIVERASECWAMELRIEGREPQRFELRECGAADVYSTEGCGAFGRSFALRCYGSGDPPFGQCARVYSDGECSDHLYHICFNGPKYIGSFNGSYTVAELVP